VSKNITINLITQLINIYGFINQRIYFLPFWLPPAARCFTGRFSRKRETCPVKHPQKLFIGDGFNPPRLSVLCRLSSQLPISSTSYLPSFRVPGKEDAGRGNRLFCPYLDTRGFFVKVGAMSPRPQTMIIEC
jgi:hypothetical protein